MFLDIVIAPDIAEQISYTNVTVISYKIGSDLYAGQIKSDDTGSKLVDVACQSTSSEDVQQTLHALVRTTRDFMSSGKWDGGHLHCIIESQKISIADALNPTTDCRKVSVVEALQIEINCVKISVSEALILSGAITPQDDEQTY